MHKTASCDLLGVRKCQDATLAREGCFTHLKDVLQKYLLKISHLLESGSACMSFEPDCGHSQSSCRDWRARGGVALTLLSKTWASDDYLLQGSMGAALDPPYLRVGGPSRTSIRSNICWPNCRLVHFQRKDLQHAQHYPAVWVSDFYLRCGLCSYFQIEFRLSSVRR